MTRDITLGNARHIAAIVIILAWGGRASALSFNFTYIDDANGTLASRGWLEPDSLFQQDIRAAANLWGARFASNATIQVQIDTHSYAARAGERAPPADCSTQTRPAKKCGSPVRSRAF